MNGDTFDIEIDEFADELTEIGKSRPRELRSNAILFTLTLNVVIAFSPQSRDESAANPERSGNPW